jgi:hypothetical protein
MQLWLPKNYEKMSYEELSSWVDQQLNHTEPVISDGLVKFNLDLFKNKQHVENVCGDNPVCWTDSIVYSVLNKTNNVGVYEFIKNRADLIGYSVIAEIKKFKFTPENTKGMLRELMEVLF